MSERSDRVMDLHTDDDADDDSTLVERVEIERTVVSEDDDDATAREIEVTRAEIEQTRAEMSETIDAIKEKLSPGHLMEEAKESVREATIGRAQEAVSNVMDSAREAVTNAGETAREAVSSAGETARDAGSTLVEAIRENPVPAAMAAISLSWLFMSARNQSERRYRADYRYDYTPRYTEGSYSPGTQSYSDTPYYVGEEGSEGGGTGERIREAVSGAGETVREAVSSTGERVRDVASSAGERVRNVASSAGERVRDVASSAGETAREAGSTIVDTIRENPLPAVVTGIGLSWLLASARSHTGGQYRYRQPPHRYDYVPRTTEASYTEGAPSDVAATGYGEATGYPYDTAAGYQAGGTGDTGRGVRERVGEVAGQAQQRVGETVERVQEKVGRLGERAQDQAERAKDGFQRMLHRNPLAVGTMAMALGAAAGLALPETEHENRMMGEARDRLVDRAQETAQEVAQKVQSVAQEAVDTAKETVKEEARNQGLTGQQSGGTGSVTSTDAI